MKCYLISQEHCIVIYIEITYLIISSCLFSHAQTSGVQPPSSGILIYFLGMLFWLRIAWTTSMCPFWAAKWSEVIPSSPRYRKQSQWSMLCYFSIHRRIIPIWSAFPKFIFNYLSKLNRPRLVKDTVQYQIFLLDLLSLMQYFARHLERLMSLLLEPIYEWHA